MLSAISHLVANANLLADTSDGAGGGALIGGSIVLIVLFWVIGIATTVLWIWMLIDCLTSSLPTNEKILWVLLIVLLPLIGSLAYLFIVRPRSRGTTSVAS
jgi:hypothetical protein